MYIGFIFNKGLPKELLKKIENREYTDEELRRLYATLKHKNATRAKGFSAALSIAIVCFAFISVLTMMNRPNSQGASVWSVFITGAILVLCMVFVKFNFRDKEKRQFMKAVKKGYPEMAERFAGTSFAFKP